MWKSSTKNLSKKILSLFCLILIVFIGMTAIVTAQESGSAPPMGSGDGSGGGSNVHFALVETKPKNGATDVNVNTTIWLLFNKNAVFMSLRENNKANIILKDADGDKVSAEVTMKDDQLEPEFRREMVVVPSEPLDPGSTYTLTVGKAVQAKNGQSLEKDYTVTFTTAGKSNTVTKQSNETKTTGTQTSQNPGNSLVTEQSSKVTKPTAAVTAPNQASTNAENSVKTVTSDAIAANSAITSKAIGIDQPTQNDKITTDPSAQTGVTSTNTSKGSGLTSGVIILILILFGGIAAVFLTKNKGRK